MSKFGAQVMSTADEFFAARLSGLRGHLIDALEGVLERDGMDSDDAQTAALLASALTEISTCAARLADEQALAAMDREQPGYNRFLGYAPDTENVE